MLLILPLELESTTFHSIANVPLGLGILLLQSFGMKLPKYLLKEWVTRCALALIADVFSEYSARPDDIFKRLTCPRITQ